MWLCCGFYNVSTPPRVKSFFLSKNSPSGNSNYEISFTHFFKIFGLTIPSPTPPPSQEISLSSVGEDGYFWELCIIFFK